MKKGGSASDKSYVQDNLQEAKVFISQNRGETLLKVASKIVEHQRSFSNTERDNAAIDAADIANQMTCVNRPCPSTTHICTPPGHP